ncbi:MAG: NADPH:quinone reductase [Actinomycetota bacterium]|nr:NADPH:quinone reductase [Actinomycetota bacterium]
MVGRGGADFQLALEVVVQPHRRAVLALDPFRGLDRRSRLVEVDVGRSYRGVGVVLGRVGDVGRVSISTLAVTAPQAVRAVADRAFRLVAEGKVRLPITGDHELGDAAGAHRLLESRASTGKIVLQVI